jgi:hypothetical protein
MLMSVIGWIALSVVTVVVTTRDAVKASKKSSKVHPVRISSLGSRRRRRQ